MYILVLVIDKGPQSVVFLYFIECPLSVLLLYLFLQALFI